MKKYYFCTAVLFILFQSCATKNYLHNCQSALLKSQPEKIIKYSFEEQYKNLGHNSEPWEKTNYAVNGEFWVTNNIFLKQDTLTNRRGKKYTSTTDYNNGVLLYLEGGETEFSQFTEDLYFEEIINTARYSPRIVLDYFMENNKDVKLESSTTHAIYSTKIGTYKVELFINRKNNLIDKIAYLSYHELYGDVTTNFVYSSYATADQILYPTSIQIEKINGKVIDTIKVLSAEIVSDDINLLDKPIDFKIIKEKELSKPEIKITKYNDYIHFIDLHHTDDKVMVVELDDYVLVAEAPINAKNGELIISEVNKIAPSKPIKYFVFGHHHPHYLGGLRAFVHKEATILCTDISKSYVEYIAQAPHSLQPDSLHISPKKIKTQIVSDSLSLGKNNEMKIYFIGEKSAHTTDFLIYYFPNDNLLFQDDLCWIPSDGTIRKAGKRQAGLYNVIKELNLDVDTIIQSWPVKNYKVKTIIPFTDLEKSIVTK